MNVRELIAKLSRLDPELPVVMEQTDEPLGDYEVLDIVVVNGAPQSPWHSSFGTGWKNPEVWECLRQ